LTGFAQVLSLSRFLWVNLGISCVVIVGSEFMP
jgi:hypothetical protein